MGDSGGFALSDTQSYYEYEFDSNEAIQGYDSVESSRDWPNFQIQRPLTDIAGLKVLETEIPFSFYTVNSFNNNFILTSTSGTFTITIPPGNYDSITMIAAVSSAMISADPLGSYVISFNATTGKFTFFSAINFSLTFPTFENSLSGNLGFNVGTTQTALTQIAPNVAAIQGAMYLYLCSESLGTLCQLYLPSSSALSQGGLGPEVAKIPINNTPFQIMNWTDPNPQHYFDVESLVTLQTLDFYLTLGTSPRKPLRLNGLSFSIKLGIIVNNKQRSEPTANITSLKRIRTV